eukprot:5018974-Amphidinium_carterae.1
MLRENPRPWSHNVSLRLAQRVQWLQAVMQLEHCLDLLAAQTSAVHKRLLMVLREVKFDLTCIWRPSNVEEYRWSQAQRIKEMVRRWAVVSGVQLEFKLNSSYQVNGGKG